MEIITTRTILWQQFGAAIDMFGNALRACPDGVWHARLWEDPSEKPEYSQFWYLAFHALFWLDYCLSGAVEGFTPPPPFTLDELDPAGLVPEEPYTQDELRAYLDYGRRKCQATIEALTDETALRLCRLHWGELTFLELLLYTMRHVQEHAAQLSLALGQQSVPHPGWVTRARDSAG
jgi:hypothetical protein